ncbi:MAG: TorF family putative porin [Steroidobacteraceae bacterium]
MRRLCCLILCPCLLWPQARAASPEWGGSLTLASDNLMRGTSRSSSDPALSAELHAQHGSGWLGALWASTSHVRPTDPTVVDFGATLGYGAPLGDDWSLRAALTHYESPWQHRSSFYRYNELAVDLRFREALLFSVSFSPDTSRFASAYGPVWKRKALAYEASWQQRLAGNLGGHAGIGYYDLSDLFGDGYWYGSAGLGWSRSGWQIDASYVIAGHGATALSYVGDGGKRGLFSVAYAFSGR